MWIRIAGDLLDPDLHKGMRIHKAKTSQKKDYMQGQIFTPVSGSAWSRNVRIRILITDIKYNRQVINKY